MSAVRPRLSMASIGAPASSKSLTTPSGRTHAILVAGRPHQRREIIAVDAPCIDTRIEQPAHDDREAARGRIGDRRLAGLIHDIGIGACGKQLLHNAVIAFECCGGERGDARSTRQIGIGTFRQEERNSSRSLILHAAKKRGRACKIARIDCRTPREK